MIRIFKGEDRVRHVRWGTTGTILAIRGSDTAARALVRWDRQATGPLIMDHEVGDLRHLDIVERVGEIEL